MVDLLHRNEHSLLVAQLTERMHLDIRITDTFPGTSVPFLHCRVPSVLFIGLAVLLGMLLTETFLRQLWTAGVMTWVFWFPWHPVTSMYNKSPKGIILPLRLHLFFRILIISQTDYCILLQTIATFKFIAFSGNTILLIALLCHRCTVTMSALTSSAMQDHV